MTRQVEYILSGLLAVYIVFFTRPPPVMIASLLANPIVQLVALGVVVLAGAKYSLIVALLLAVAFAASVPGREYADDASMKPKCKAGESYDSKQKKCVAAKTPVMKPSAAPKPVAPKKDTEPKPAPEDALETFASGGGIEFAPY